ncbi:PREDICTED: uncharacterized protein LOC106820479, partial [Priapulus caudatus]|uniref:Uncharacterized protein LOC106820479 n=1 Tax=Priapulus caudatus TaxID=37621 RepID=A0ABM1F7Q7_PRICU
MENCYAGATYYIKLLLISHKDQVLSQSRQLNVQTSASPDTPILSLRACNFKYIAIQWEKPSVYGSAHITSYRLFINGVVESNLSPQQTAYTFTSGAWCREYVFQLQ